MSRFYCLPQEINENRVVIEQREEIHHIVDVMRQEQGDEVVVFDGTGKQYHGIIKEISSRKIVIDILSLMVLKEPEKKLCLACAIPKKAKFDYIIQKVTELGVDEIIPMVTERTIVKVREEQPKIKRWQKICIEATKQCGRVDLPKLEKILTFKEVVRLVGSYDLAIIPHLAEDRKDLRDLDLSGIRSMLILVGPEGDFNREEIGLALTSGCIPVSLGNNVLKVDTAAIFSVGNLAYQLKKI